MALNNTPTPAELRKAGLLKLSDGLEIEESQNIDIDSLPSPYELKPQIKKKIEGSGKQTADEINYDTNLQKEGNLPFYGAEAAGLLAQVPRIVGNLSSFVFKAVDPRQASSMLFDIIDPNIAINAKKQTESLKEYGNKITETLESKLGVSSTGKEVFRTTADIGSTFGIPGGVLGKGGLLRSGAQGAIESLKYSAVARGELPTKQEVGIGTAFGAAGSALQKGFSKITQELPEKLQLSGLLNSAKLTQVSRQVSEAGAESPKNVAKWMLDRGISGNKEEVVDKLILNAEMSKNVVDQALQTIPGTFKPKQGKEALELLLDNIGSVKGLDKEKDEILSLMQKIDSEGLSLFDVNKIKRLIDSVDNPFTISGDVRSSLQKQGIANIRRDLKRFIEGKSEAYGNQVDLELFKNIRKLNNETQVSRTLASAIAKKDSADQTREFLSVFASRTLGGGFGVAGVGPFPNETIEGKIGNMFFGAFLGNLSQSTLAKTKVAGFLNKLGKTEKAALESLVKSRGGIKPSDEVAESITEKISESGLINLSSKELREMAQEAIGKTPKK